MRAAKNAEQEPKRQSATQRLRTLPNVFSGGDLTQLLNVSKAAASVMLHRWKEAELVRPLGGRSDVFINLVSQPNWRAAFQDALKRAMPVARVIGPEAWRERGWTTQISYHLDVAIPTKAAGYSVEGLRIHRRGRRWWSAVERGQHPPAAGRLAALRPAVALADALLAQAAQQAPRPSNLQGLGAPAPDDLHATSATRRDLREFRAAICALAAAYDLKLPTLPPKCDTLAGFYEYLWRALVGHR